MLIMFDMDDTELARIVGKNITSLRKTAGMTQLELAEKLNYSDKSVSKWEQGNGLPDIHVLMNIANLFGVTLDDLVHVQRERKFLPRTLRLLRRAIIMASSAGVVWLVAVICFVGIKILAPQLDFVWLAFLYAVPVSAIVILVFACVWNYKWLRLIVISVIIWTTLACIYLTLYAYGHNVWLIFLIGIPLQLLALIYFLWWKKLKFNSKQQ